MDIIEIIGLVAGTCTASSLVPQLVKTIKEKHTADLSLIMLLVLLTGNLLWIFYGFSKSEVPIIATNIFSTILNAWLIFLKLRYK